MGNMRFKVGDRVRIKSLDWYNRYTNGTEVDCGAYPFTSDMKEFCGQERIIANVCQECYLLLGIDDKFVWTDEMIEGLAEETKSIDFTIKTTDTKGKVEVVIPEGYGYVVENDKLYFITKKKEVTYPKTYEECCKVLDVCSGETLQYGDLTILNDYEFNLYMLLENFRKLRICRDAYWKIAGEEMGLDKPWEPDWSDTSIKYCLERDFDTIDKNVSNHKGHTFAFPTEEMRDAFKENFDPDLEICKEFL